MNEALQGPIGVFDSGLGGLTGLRRLRRLAPDVDLIYFGDTARVPYGTREVEELRRFARQNVDFLRSQGAQRVLIACGTISSILSPADWAALPLPCQGVVQAASDAALAASRNKRIGILATPATIRSGSYVRCMTAAQTGLTTVPVPCPAFVPLIESGRADSAELLAAAREYLMPIREAGCDTVILGCTHYPLISSLLQRELGSDVVLVDSAGEAARLLLRDLTPRDDRRIGSVRCFVSGNAAEFSANAAQLLGEDLLDEVIHIDF